MQKGSSNRYFIELEVLYIPNLIDTKLLDIPLPSSTIQRWTGDLKNNIIKILITRITKNSPFGKFSITLDGTTNCADISQLAFLICWFDKDGQKEHILSLVFLLETTKNIYIYNH